MNKQFFIGIDVSKLKIDVFIFQKNRYHQFTNDIKGFEIMVRWISKSIQKVDLFDAVICFEHTGIYSLSLALYLEEKGIPFSMTSALQIKRSMGIARGKNDRIDAKRIAEYAFRHRDILVQTKLPTKTILKLQPLLTLRDRLVRSKAGYEATRREQSHFLPENDFPELYETYNLLIADLKAKVRKLEKTIKEIIAADEEIKKNFELITKIKGVGLIVGTYMIVYTHNFTRFSNWRKFACYSGIAPFDFQSGTSIHGKPRVNGIANRQMKKMLHISAMHAAYTDKEMSAYFQKRLESGYNKMSTLNAIRNKILARVFAVVRRQTPYVELLGHVA